MPYVGLVLHPYWAISANLRWNKTWVCSCHFPEHCRTFYTKHIGFATKLVWKPETVPFTYPVDTEQTCWSTGKFTLSVFYQLTVQVCSVSDNVSPPSTLIHVQCCQEVCGC